MSASGVKIKKRLFAYYQFTIQKNSDATITADGFKSLFIFLHITTSSHLLPKHYN
jgi:hypothetical protein